MNILRKQLFKLGIPEQYLVITDNTTGAGYIVDSDDNVFCRWGFIQEGIAILEAYIDAEEHGYDTEIEPSNRGWQRS